MLFQSMQFFCPLKNKVNHPLTSFQSIWGLKLVFLFVLEENLKHRTIFIFIAKANAHFRFCHRALPEGGCSVALVEGRSRSRTRGMQASSLLLLLLGGGSHSLRSAQRFSLISFHPLSLLPPSLIRCLYQAPLFSYRCGRWYQLQI